MIENAPSVEKIESNTKTSNKDKTAAWRATVLKFQKPSTPKATWQLINTVGSYVALWFLMYWSLSVSWFLTIPLALLTAAFHIRMFIIFHDCGHGSFYGSKIVNDTIGIITGLMNFTSYHHWRWEHSVHHATSGHLDKRGTGDVWTMTVQEYLESSRWKRFAYRLARNPFILFGIAPLVLFWVLERYPSSKAPKRERYAVYMTNLALIFIVSGMGKLFGWKEYFFIQLIVSSVAGAMGVWLFYVQHQFEGVYWERADTWDYTTAALQGSSFYKLPRVLQWFSGNIGFHHIHHLSSRIPNYNLEQCYKSDPLFQEVKPITLMTSLKSFSYRLWDEQQRKLVGYRHLRELKKMKKDQDSSSKQHYG